jgi:predicted CxxxxCH...CXXCH cytochrome family protein
MSGSGTLCTSCHNAGTTYTNKPDSEHADGLVDTLPSVGYTDEKGKGTAPVTCTTAYCHANVYGGGEIETPVWGTASGCSACHTTKPIAALGPETGSHTKHMSASGTLCISCHNAGTTYTNKPDSEHADGVVDTIASIGYTDEKGKGTAPVSCSTASCHNAYGSSGIATPVWGTLSNCGSCHTIGAAGAPETGSHTKHLASTPTPDCSACHDGASKDVSGGSGHTDGNIDATNGYPADVTKHAAGTYTGTCSTANCHADQYSETTRETPVWGTVSGCSACHKDGGAFEANGGPATGSHSKHLESVFHMPVCGDCHAGAVKDETGGDNHGDGNIDMTVGGYPTDITKHTSGSGYSSCSTAYCHSSGQSLTDGNSALATYSTATWNDPTTGECGDCHAAAKAAVIAVNSGSHAAHLNAVGVSGCSECHTGVEDDGSLYSSNTLSHVDGSIDVATSVTYTGSGAPGNGYATCTTAYCHDNGRGVSAPYTPLWGTVVTDCSECHERQPSTGSHPEHLASLYHKPECGDCHDGAIEADTEPTTHLDGNVDVFDVNNTTPNTDLGYLANVPKHNDDVYQSCTTAYCHSSGQSLDGSSATPVYDTVTWNGTAGCGSCHKTKAGDPLGAIDTGSHTKHMNSTIKSPAVGCSDCHTGATSSSYNSTNHVNKSIDVVSGYGYTLAGAPGNGYDSCTTSYCHSNGKLAYQSAAWGVSVSPGCTFCHPTLSGAHTKHVVFTNSAVYGSTAVNVSSSTASYDFGCGNCHPTGIASHMNGIVNVSLAPGDGGTLKAKNSASWSYASNQCNGVYCHSDGQVTSYKLTPVWTGSFPDANNTCGQCHGNSPASGAHVAHAAATAVHYDDIHNGGIGKVPATGGAGTGAGHGDTGVSTTINCNVCHSGALSVAYNDKNTSCTVCHTATVKGSIVSANMTKTVHVNGTPNVSMTLTAFRSRAQIRNDITVVAELNNYWTRTNGYKAGVNSYDAAKGAPSYDGAGTCSSVACHNGHDVSWTGSVTCKSCHTALPR